MSLSDIRNSLRRAVRGRDGNWCVYCHLNQAGQVATFHIDHIVPRSKGGPTAIENLATQCPYCSLRKSDKIEAVDPITQKLSPLFHPLTQSWEDHFAMGRDGSITGLTAIGRATVNALKMNDSMPRTARVLQIMLGIC